MIFIDKEQIYMYYIIISSKERNCGNVIKSILHKTRSSSIMLGIFFENVAVQKQPFQVKLA